MRRETERGLPRCGAGRASRLDSLSRGERVDLLHPFPVGARFVEVPARVLTRVLLNACAQVVVHHQAPDRIKPRGIGLLNEQPAHAIDHARVVDRRVRVHAGDAARGIFAILVVALASMKRVVRQGREPDVEAFAGKAREEPIVIANEG